MIYLILLTIVITLFVGIVFTFTCISYLLHIAMNTSFSQYIPTAIVLATSLTVGIIIKMLLSSTRRNSLDNSKLNKLEDFGAWLIALPEPFGELIYI